MAHGLFPVLAEGDENVALMSRIRLDSCAWFRLLKYEDGLDRATCKQRIRHVTELNWSARGRGYFRRIAHSIRRG